MDTKITTLGPGLFAALLTAGVGLAGEPMAMPLADRLLAENGKILSVRCEIRRETEVGGTTVPTLSRVWFERSDRLRVETVTPDARRIVVDGKAIYKWIDGQKQGVRLPLAEAPGPELIQVRRVPGTAEEYLLRLRGLPETELPAEAGFPVRRAYTPSAPHPYTVLSLDATGRLARVEFFDPDVRTNRLLRVDFEGWKEAKPGIWIACLQKTEAWGRDGMEVRETLRVNALAVNDPIEPEQFDVVRQASGVQFLKVEEMAELLRREKNR
jgi:hypothetical protein